MSHSNFTTGDILKAPGGLSIHVNASKVGVVKIGKDITLYIVKTKKFNTTKVVIQAPKDLRIERQEFLDRDEFLAAHEEQQSDKQTT